MIEKYFADKQLKYSAKGWSPIKPKTPVSRKPSLSKKSAMKVPRGHVKISEQSKVIKKDPVKRAGKKVTPTLNGFLTQSQSSKALS